MPTMTYAGTEVEVNDEGFFVHPEQWTADIAVELAKADGIDPLTADHWKVIEFMRREYAEKGTGPTDDVGHGTHTIGSVLGNDDKHITVLELHGSASIAATPPIGNPYPQWMSGIAYEKRRIPGRWATFTTWSRLGSLRRSAIMRSSA